MVHNDFDTNGLAKYLHVTPAQVKRLADRGKIPGRKVSSQWRFARADIHHWLEDRIGLSDEEGLVEMESVLHRSQRPDHEPQRIGEMLPLEAIQVPLLARTRGKVISAIAEVAAQAGLLWDPAKMAEAVRNREELHPTALDNGVALLHPRRPLPSIMAEPFLALGKTHQGIPFGGDGLTDIFFLIGSTDDASHLKTLARLSRLISRPGFVETLRAVNDAPAALEVVENFEAEIPD